jgi:Flp pilus assembly protein TadD
LRATDQRTQAVAVLEQASIRNPRSMPLLGAYGRALAEAGQYKQAIEALGRAHTPDNPDWSILNVQGAVLDQMGRHAEAQRHYAAALKIVPDEPSVLSNLGLSYLLTKDLKNAEITLRRAVAQPNAGPKYARTWRWSSACGVASRRRKKSPVRTCPTTKPPPTSIICGKCLRSRAT